jgi:phosphotransferase system  glucose/maltose/N-acetylglucosamine-specific IIC component
MSRTTSSARAKVNVPLIVLWLASVVVAVVGYLLMTSSNSQQAALYTSGAADYPKLFAAQSGSTIGGLLIAVGVLGVLLALAAQVIASKRVAAPVRLVVDEAELESDDDEPYVDETVDHVVPVEDEAKVGETVGTR